MYLGSKTNNAHILLRVCQTFETFASPFNESNALHFNNILRLKDDDPVYRLPAFKTFI